MLESRVGTSTVEMAGPEQALRTQDRPQGKCCSRLIVSAPDLADLWRPYNGSCGLCGGPDARHRLFEAISERHAAGDSSSHLATDYATDVATIEAVLVHELLQLDAGE